MDEVMQRVFGNEDAVIGRGMNGHVGNERRGYERVCGGYSFKGKNEAGERILDFAVSYNLAVSRKLVLKFRLQIRMMLTCLSTAIVEIDEIPEKEIEVTHDQNTNTLDQYNSPSFKSPKSWYTSDTINDYLKLIAKRLNGEVYAVVTDFIPAYLRGGYPAARRWIKKDIHTLKLLFVPMNVYGEHWILTDVNVPQRTVTSYDSLKSYDGSYPMVFKEYLTDWEMDEKGAASSWTLKIGETIHQTNGYDCDPFTVELAEKMARGDTTPINASLMPFVRHREEIIAGQLFL
ncbi:sentrin-specific protease 1-like [Daktulosphaira vitifoliae]|uniref:sentrin-specific protease 1-like n=1 Tax=Daktulosphaira vitifoliae TaxID=58002 RepID=UPI0021A98B69|nr:sentrin-specific protease 1-like [Daktulosphaira vitifoliae]